MSSPLLRLTHAPARELVEAFPGATISGVMVFGLVDSGDGFVCPVTTGPSDDHIADMPAFDRAVLASTLRMAAEKIQP